MAIKRLVGLAVLTMTLLGAAAFAFSSPLSACECLSEGQPYCCGAKCGGNPCYCTGGCD